MADPTFDGFSRRSLLFFRDLSQNNDRKWFQQNKELYTSAVVEPAQAFVEVLGGRLAKKHDGLCFDTRANGGGSIFRIHRDTRFSRDLTPYKTNLGVLFWHHGPGSKKENPGYYFHLEEGGAMMYAGLYGLPKVRLDQYRKAVADEVSGVELRNCLSRIEKGGLETGGAHYKRVPAGYAADHPRADLLRYNALWARSGKIPRKILLSADLISWCQKFCASTAPLNQWLLDHT